MFHPAPPPAGSAFVDDDFQFIEFRNTGLPALSLQGLDVSGGVQFRFQSGTLDSGAYIVIVKNTAAFQSRYGASVPIAGEFAGTLDHGAGRILVTGPLGEPIAEVNYDDAWYPVADGSGFSLVSRAETAAGS